MLYDPKWEKKVAPKQRNRFSRWLWPLQPEEVFELTDFISWVALQPHDKGYKFTSPNRCAIAQYLQTKGVTEMHSMVCPVHLHPALNVLNTGGPSSDYTFGALRDRLMRAR